MRKVCRKRLNLNSLLQITIQFCLFPSDLFGRSLYLLSLSLSLSLFVEVDFELRRISIAMISVQRLRLTLTPGHEGTKQFYLVVCLLTRSDFIAEIILIMQTYIIVLPHFFLVDLLRLQMIPLVLVVWARCTAQNE
jgi:hypothetical protein